MELPGPVHDGHDGPGLAGWPVLFDTTAAHGSSSRSGTGSLSIERSALVALYHATNGTNWTTSTHWNTDVHLSRWHGIKVNNQGRVIEIHLSNNNLEGSIPPDLGNLPTLRYLHLGNNTLSGEIPASLGQLGNLQELHLDESMLSGEIPASLGQLSKLERLHLHDNKFSGPIPPALGKLAALKYLNLGANYLSGQIPPQLGNLHALASLELHSNKLNAPLPKELGDLAALENLHLEGTELKGPIPLELGNLVALRQLSLWNNNLSGLIPPALGTLAALTHLVLASNQLSGNIPSELGNLGAMTTLRLCINKLTGSIPKELGGLTKLEVLDLKRNQLTGEIPASLGQLSQLVNLHLSRNKLSGCLPEALGALSELWLLDLANNQLSGSIPKELGGLTKLKRLYLNQNHLTGEIPASLGQLGNLSILRLHNNNLSGSIPKELESLTKLEDLHLENNQLSGPIPPELGALSELQNLRLFNNQLTGPIPKELGALTKLESLRLDNNQLSGPIPPELGNLAVAKSLDLVNNQLTAFWDHTQDVQDLGHEMGPQIVTGGPVPSQLCRLLDVLDRTRFAIENNPWTEPPESIVRKGGQSIRGYFEDLFAEPHRIQRNSIKVLLVGQEGAGKSSLRQSMKANKAHPTGEWKEESTVFADVETMELEGAFVRVYDCAGQVAYTGLLQMFLTSRSVCVLVCDAKAFGQPCSETDDQLEEDCRTLEQLRVCEWLRSISWRVPDSDVILVATKCDLAGGHADQIGRRMERACRAWLASWVCDGMQPVRLEHGVCLTSCRVTRVDGQDESSGEKIAPEEGWACDWRDDMDETPPPSLFHRLVNKRDGGLRGVQMVLPRSWDIALTVLEALECGRDPVKMVVQIVAADADDGESTETAEAKAGVYQGMTIKELSAKWQETVYELSRRGIKVTNPENALEGALSIREFDGSLVRHETFVFLDVVWLGRILKPLLNHKDKKTFDGRVNLGDTGDTRITLVDPLDINSWGRLKSEGVLETRLAHAMWPTGLSEYVLPALQSLGLTFPLVENDPAKGMVVLLRLTPHRPARVGHVIDKFCLEHTPVFSVSWEIFLGVPAGAIEKVLTRCCSLGGVRTFWRYGVLVYGGFDNRDVNSLVAVVLEYSSIDKELTAQIYGDISSPATWTALSYVISAVRVMLQEFSGLRGRGSLSCPQHGDAMLLANTATRVGDKLLTSGGCSQCSPDTRGLGAAAIDLLRMVDIRRDRGVIFDEVKERFVSLEGQYTFPNPSTSSKDEDVLIQKFDGLAATVKEVKGEMKEVFGEVKNQMKEGFGEVKSEMKEGFREVTRGLDKVAESICECLMHLKSLQAPNYPYPHLVTVNAIESGGGSLRTQRKRSLLSKLSGVFMKEATVHFLCPVDMTKVPCGYGGEGYRFRDTRGWVKKLSPVLLVAVVTAKVALKATIGMDVEISSFMNDVKNGLGEELVDRTFDEDALCRVVSGEGDVSAELQSDTRASYEMLKKFMDKEQAERRKHAVDGDGYVDFRDKMKRVDDGRGGMVWVRNENVQKWAVVCATNPPV